MLVYAYSRADFAETTRNKNKKYKAQEEAKEYSRFENSRKSCSLGAERSNYKQKESAHPERKTVTTHRRRESDTETELDTETEAADTEYETEESGEWSDIQGDGKPFLQRWAEIQHSPEEWGKLWLPL